MLYYFSHNSILVLATTTLVFHGFILINRGNYFDGWYLAGWTNRHAWGVMERFYKEVGMPYLYYLHRFLTSLPNHSAWYSLIIFMSIFSGSVFAGNFLISSGICSEREALLISILMVCYPGFVIGVEKTLIHYYITPSTTLASLLTIIFP